MSTFLNVNFALLPIAIFSVLFARGMPEVAVRAGFLASVVIATWRAYRSEARMLEYAILLIFAALAFGVFLWPHSVAAQALPLVFAGLGVFALGTVLLRRPWTLEFSRAAHAGEA